MNRFSILDFGFSIEKSGSKQILCFALCAMLFALSASAHAQQPDKVFRIGYLDVSTPSYSAGFLKSFWQQMNKLGWVDGKNITMVYRFAEQKPGRLPELAAELTRLGVDLIVCSGTPSVLAARNAAAATSIVMASGGDPVAAGLVTSLARPGGSITGLASLEPQLITKRLEVLKDVVPRLARVGVLWFAGGPGIQQRLALKELRNAAIALEVQLHEIETKVDPEGLEKAFQTAVQKQVNAIMTASARTLLTERSRITALAIKYRLPAMYPEDEIVAAGGLMSYGVDRSDIYQRAAFYVDKILKGTKPADLPVEQPKKFELVINLKTAKQIGLTIPPNVLARADRVIR